MLHGLSLSYSFFCLIVQTVTDLGVGIKTVFLLGCMAGDVSVGRIPVLLLYALFIGMCGNSGWKQMEAGDSLPCILPSDEGEAFGQCVIFLGRWRINSLPFSILTVTDSGGGGCSFISLVVFLCF